MSVCVFREEVEPKNKIKKQAPNMEKRNHRDEKRPLSRFDNFTFVTLLL